MKGLDRFFLVFAAAALIIVAGLIAATIAGSLFFVDWLLSPDLMLDGGMVVLIIGLLAAYLILLAARFERQKFVVHRGDLGEVRLSVSCIQDLLEEVAERLPGIRRVAAAVTDVEEFKVRLDIEVFPAESIPQLSEELQKTTRDYLEETVGVPVQMVEVVVRKISDGSETRLL
ncbi:MAG TPA: alkaline shock response membrane anchor protein AmaP [Firmicutes bacterium]|nr:alkaline shock response membrane anchor protein AmaP [Bacillota bacterium]